MCLHTCTVLHAFWSPHPVLSRSRVLPLLLFLLLLLAAVVVVRVRGDVFLVVPSHVVGGVIPFAWRVVAADLKPRH